MAERQPQPAASAFHPATVQLGTRSFPIDPSPLPRTNPWDGQRRTIELKHLTDDCLVLEPKERSFLWHALLMLGIAAGPLTGVVYMLVEEIRGNADWGGIVIWSIGSLLMFAFLVLGLSAPGRFKRWVRFDRRAGQLTISRRGFGFRRPLQVVQERPLTDLVCIQLLYGGFHSESTEIGEPGTPGSVIYQNYHSYQLNLVFHDQKEPRYNLATHSDWKWMREAGQTLADFLGIPVADQLAHSA
jgi:hypothetical protein